MKKRMVACVIGMCLTSWPVAGEVVSSSPRQFVLSHVVQANGTSSQVWARLIDVKSWWANEHTYSGNAKNLRLSASAGGCWCERWAGNSVEHARVVYMTTGNTLRLDGGFGPLQAMAVRGILEFKLEPSPQAGKTQIRMTYLVNGVPESKLNEIAPAVDGVMGAQIARLGGLGD